MGTSRRRELDDRSDVFTVLGVLLILAISSIGPTVSIGGDPDAAPSGYETISAPIRT